MEHTRDNQQKKITASKVERDELYLYSLKKMADNNINSNESPLTGSVSYTHLTLPTKLEV